jgi:ribose 5-phosphate isomerase B
MKIAIAADHAGHPLMDVVAAALREQGHEAALLGADPPDPNDDYPDAATLLCEAVRNGEAERGVLLCGSGVGACVAANKFPGIRAAICHDAYSARQGVEHDDMNVLCLGARVIGVALAADLVRAFAGARFSGEERHRRRLGKVQAIEARFQREY